MADPEQLPHLLKLIDDPSPLVQEVVGRELAAFGPRLDHELSRLHAPLTEDQLQNVRTTIDQYHRSWLALHWPSWKNEVNHLRQLEGAHDLLARFQYGNAFPVRLPALLDQLAAECRERNPEPTAFQLAHYLFQVLPLRGDRQTYYDPRNSNLVYCILERKGIPISLCCIYMLVGHRLGLEICGLPLPGHFLAAVQHGGQTYAVDCFAGGRFLSDHDLAALHRPIAGAIRHFLAHPADAPAMIQRALHNLHRAYLQQRREADAMLMIDLLSS
jgi:hypothetical protein